MRRVNMVSFNMFRLTHTDFSGGTIAKWKVRGDKADDGSRRKFQFIEIHSKKFRQN